jgi:glyoxylase-like metal-dependent hydrolase (beta-lactamase superfamily II)
MNISGWKKAFSSRAATFDEIKKSALAESNDMSPVEGTVDVEVPISELWEIFTRADLWPRWNRCMLWVRNRDLVPGRRLLWAFRPIRRWYPYVLPAIAKIVDLEDERRVTWEVTALPGFYARHTYHMRKLGRGRTRFGSWEKAMGQGFRLTKWFWIPHFVFVRDRSLEGSRLLERVYLQQGKLDGHTLPRAHSRLPVLLLLMPALASAGALLWFYISYVRQRIVGLAPGVYAVLGGGGNSLIVVAENEVLLVDPKFPPVSRQLRRWIRRTSGAPVTRLVNTHYHYDHTQGNVLYPEAAIFAHEKVPHLMLSRDNAFNSRSWWERHRDAVPSEILDGGEHRLKVGDREVMLFHPGQAHTGGDLVVSLPDHGIVATGDLVFNGYYPFLDVDEDGVSLPDLIEALRNLARSHPTAVFIPGHGPLARADDLHHHADYLEQLYESVARACADGLSEDEAVRQVDLSGWKYSVLPTFHRGRLSWSTARNNVRWVYQLMETSQDG